MKIELTEIKNFRKLKSVRIDFSDKTTVFVGANNSGKTSAIFALKKFLVGSKKNRFSLDDITMSHWPEIDNIGSEWEKYGESIQEEVDTAIQSKLDDILPFLDIWLQVKKSEAYLIQKLIPTLKWKGGQIGVRLKLEPIDYDKLRENYIARRKEVLRIEEADQSIISKSEQKKSQDGVLWPLSLCKYMERRINEMFSVKYYILDPTKLRDPEFGEAFPQKLLENMMPIDGEPLKELIKINTISAQRGFGQLDGTREFEDEEDSGGQSSIRRLSEQLKRYWKTHLDPMKNPDPSDLEALRAIEQAQQAFDERLEDGFSGAMKEVEEMGYPGITDPKLKISSQLKPVEGLNHEAAVQYVAKTVDGAKEVELYLPEESNGLGYQNLISMIFRLMSFRDAWMRVGKADVELKERDEDKIPRLHLVLIEEPEAHLHTQVQQVFIRQAYKVLRNNSRLGDSTDFSTQLVISTHSSHIAIECEFDQLRYFRRLPTENKSVPTSRVVNLSLVFGSLMDTTKFVTRYLKVTHCDLFFADAAIFVEGSAERMLVPYFIRNSEELNPLNNCYITWLEIGGSHSHRLKELIEQLGLTTLIITDLDAKKSDGTMAIPEKGKGLTTRNKTLIEWCPKKENLDELFELDDRDKSIWYEDLRFSVCVAYQCPVEIEFNGKKYFVPCNTFEDALVMENLEFISKNEGIGLWKKFKNAIENSESIEELQKELHSALKSGGKAEFALSLLELGSSEIIHPPGYILSGLNWLLVQLNERQKEMGIANEFNGNEEVETKS